MLDAVPCNVSSAPELDAKIRNILALDNVGRGDEIGGTLNVYYSDDSARLASLIPVLESRGVMIAWHKI